MTQRRNTFLFDMKRTCMLKTTNKSLLLLLLYLARCAAPFFSGSHIQKQVDGSVGCHYAIALGLGTVERAALVVSFNHVRSVRRRHQHVQHEQPTHNPQEQHGDRMSSITTRSLMWRLQFIVIGRVSLARENEAGGSWGQKVHILHVNVYDFALFLVLIIELFQV